MRATPEVLGVQCARCRMILHRIEGAGCYGEFAQQLPSEDAARLWPDHYCFRKFVTDAARPLPEPEQPQHQPSSSFGYAYCAVCRADWPCHAAKEAQR